MRSCGCPPRLEALDELGADLRRAVRSVAIDRLRRRRVSAAAQANRAARARIFRLPAAPGSPDPERLAQALALLPVEQREVLVLRVWGEMSYQDIAPRQRTVAPLGTVHSRYRVGMERLRAALQERGHL